MIDSTRLLEAAGRMGGAVLVLAVLASPRILEAQEVTYARDVAPILRENCETCHQPGTTAPMTFQTYEEVRPWAPMIREQVEARLMPPGWYIDRTVGIQAFKNDPSLSAEEIATIASWVDAGAPEGEAVTPLPPLDMRAGHEYWEAEELMGWGPPDVIIESPPYTVEANGQDQWWMPDTPLPQITERRWIRAVETRPADEGSGYVFHHANTNLVREGDEDRGGGLSSAAVGKRLDLYPDDAGKLIMPGDILRYRLHLFPIGETVPDARIQLGIWFYPEGEEPRFVTNDETGFQTGESRALGLPRYTDYLIPPNGRQLVRGLHVLDRNARVHSIRGHMHLRGGYQMMEAVYPGGECPEYASSACAGGREIINKIDWHHKWHTTHIYEDWAQPLLPKGTVIISTSLFDNTADNPSNPDPDQWVVYNRRSAGEMGHIRFGITWLEDNEFEELVEEREDLLRQRTIAQEGGADTAAGG